MRWLRPIAVLTLTTGVSVGVASRHTTGTVAALGTSARLPAGTYSFTRLDLLDTALFHVEETYVEPHRVDWERMFVEGLSALETRLPPVLLARDADHGRLDIEIGAFRTTLERPIVRGRAELVLACREVAQLLSDHLDESEIPVRVGRPPWPEVEYLLVNGVLSTLDPHSVLLRPDDATDLDTDNRGEYGGIGVNVIVDELGRLKVEEVHRGTPAEAAGLRPGDVIHRVDGESTLNMELGEALPRLRGPVDSTVLVEVERPGATGLLHFQIVRSAIASNPVLARLLDGDVGYVGISSFHLQVERDLVAELARLERESAHGLRGLVLDLRGNPGGFLTQAIAISDMFLTGGDIVSTVDGSGRKRDLEVARSSGSEPTYPMAVLVDSRSASASEIVAGALRNNERAVIVGQRSFGKGSVQTLAPMGSEGAKLKLTISKYLTPGDRSIQSVGIPADIELLPSLVQAAFEGGPDHPAISLLHHELAQREADLEAHLEDGFVRTDPPTWTVRYLDTWRAPMSPPVAPEADAQIAIARDVLLAASGWRRADVLAGAGDVVSGLGRSESARLVRAFAELGVDWRDGPPMPRRGDAAPVELTLKVGDTGQLVARSSTEVTVTVTNLADRPLYRVLVAAREHSVLQGAEFPIGHLAPGATRSWTHRVVTPPGAPSEMPDVVLELRDGGEGALHTVVVPAPVEASPRPELRWSWSWVDAGDGDGLPEAGEAVELALDVQNVGGDGIAPVARLVNRAGRVLDPVRGTLAATANTGSPLPTDGRWTPSFRFQLGPEARLGQTVGMEIELGDDRVWDLIAVGENGWWRAAWPRVPVELRVGEAFPAGEPRAAPLIEVTRVPALRLPGGREGLSGVVTDDTGIACVMVFLGTDKVFHTGSGNASTLTSVPFSADLNLEEGNRPLSVVAIDRDGLVATWSVGLTVEAEVLARGPTP